MAAGAEYCLDINSGGTPLSIFFGHFLDSFVHVLGEFKDLKANMRTDYLLVDIVYPAGDLVTKDYRKTTPDGIQILGTLSSGP